MSLPIFYVKIMKCFPLTYLILLFTFSFSSCVQQDTFNEEKDQLQYEIEQIKIDIQDLQKRKLEDKKTLDETEASWSRFINLGKIERLRREIIDLEKEIQDKKLELTFKTKRLKALKNPRFDWRIVYGTLALLLLAVLGFWAYRKLAK